MSSFSFDAAALLTILAQPTAQRAMAVYAQPDILQAAKDNCSTKFPGGRTTNPAPGTVHGDTGVYMRSEVFRDTLQLSISGDGELTFSSTATSTRKKSGITFNYGQALIDGRLPFKGPYKLLPPDYYT